MMKRTVSLLLALLLTLGCAGAVSAEVTTDPVQAVIDGINAFMDVEDVFNNCDSHYIDEAEYVANINSGALDFVLEEENMTEGYASAKFSKQSSDPADIPMIIRSGSEWYAEAYDYLAFDVYVSEDMTVNQTEPGQALAFGYVKLQTEWVNNPDEGEIVNIDILDEISTWQAGAWNHVVLDLPADVEGMFRQITIRTGHACLTGDAGAYLLLDNVKLGYTEQANSVEIDTEDETALRALEAAYNGLTDEQKAQVVNYEALASWLAKLEELLGTAKENIKKVEEMIAALPDAEQVAPTDEAAIVAAREALDALTYDERKEVSNKDRLEAIEAALEELKKPDGLRGDVDGNEKVDASDALLVLKAAVGKAELTDAQAAAADLNADGKIDASDALIILKIAVGKE